MFFSKKLERRIFKYSQLQFDIKVGLQQKVRYGTANALSTHCVDQRFSTFFFPRTI